MAITRGTSSKNKAATVVVPAAEVVAATVGNAVVVSSKSIPTAKSSTKSP